MSSYKPYILGVGHLSVEKNFCDLIEAFSEIKNKNINLVIIGSGNKQKELEIQIKKLGLDKRIFLLGSVNNPFPAYVNAEVFVSSSIYEGWPNVIIESMACDCAVISYDCSYGPAEIITHQENGLLVEPNNVNQLSQQIEQLINNPQLKEALIKNAKEKLDAFEIKKIASAWIDEQVLLSK
jgi:glycosyltransferase involved in cell wall biosynthesis